MKLFTIFIIALILAATSSYYYYFQINRFVFQVEMAVESELESEIAQVFFDIGRSYNEQDSKVARVECDNEDQVLSFAFPIKKVKYIRFDPLQNEGKIVLKGIKIVTGQKKEFIRLTIDDLMPLNDIQSIIRQNDGTIALTTTKNAGDPSMLLKFSPPGALFYLKEIFSFYYLKELFTFGAKLFLFYFLAIALSLISFKTSFNQESRSKKGPEKTLGINSSISGYMGK